MKGAFKRRFCRKNGREVDFEKDMPKTCVRDDAHMGQRSGIKEDGTLVAVAAVLEFTK